MGAHVQPVSHKPYAEKVATDMGLNPGMGSSASVSHKEAFPCIRQRELQAWRDIMCSLFSAASLLIFSESNGKQGFRELTKVCSCLNTLQKCTVHWYILLAFLVNTRKLFVPSVRKSGEKMNLSIFRKSIQNDASDDNWTITWPIWTKPRKITGLTLHSGELTLIRSIQISIKIHCLKSKQLIFQTDA